jgi:hypothetical protein
MAAGTVMMGFSRGGCLLIARWQLALGAILVVMVSGVPAMASVHEQMHQGAGQDEKIGKVNERMVPVGGERKAGASG